MTNKPMLSVELRELLGKAASLLEIHSDRPSLETCVADDLRALLDNSSTCAESQVEPDAWKRDMDYRPEELGSPETEPVAHPLPDPVLCKFYDVNDWPGLVRELVGHVAQLQDSAKRNVKPWEDTFPPTLLPAYIERVNTANAAAQHQGHAIPQWLRDHFSGIEDEAMKLGGCGVFTQMRTKVQAYFEMIRKQVEAAAVVMPERKPQDLSRDDQPMADWFEEVGYNKALDDVARLNGVNS